MLEGFVDELAHASVAKFTEPAGGDFGVLSGSGGFEGVGGVDF